MNVSPGIGRAIPIIIIVTLIRVSSSLDAGSVKENALLSFPITLGTDSVATQLTIDGNWRWVRYATNYSNCFTSSWVCGSQCDSCVVEGAGSVADYLSTYGVSVDGKGGVKLRYVTGSNVGSRLFLLNQGSYKLFDVRNKSVSFDVDISQVPCGINHAVYFIEIPQPPKFKSGKSAAEFGLGYGDSQGPSDIKYYHNGSQWVVNTAKVSLSAAEFDLAESNNQALQYTGHVCNKTGISVNNNKCDKPGADVNYYRLNGKSLGIDFSKNFTIVTEFHDTYISRYYKQGSLVVYDEPLNDTLAKQRHIRFGENPYGYNHSQMMASAARGWALIISLWYIDSFCKSNVNRDDSSSAEMRWLDSVYGGSVRGTCDPSANYSPSYLRSKYPNAYAILSNFKVSPLQGQQSPSAPPTPPACVKEYEQCGTCCTGLTCVYINDYYSQCQSVAPTPTPSPSPSSQWTCYSCVPSA